MRAHIIPKSFYDLDHSQPVPLEIITNSESGYNSKSFVGIYDTSIVTDRGERIFSDWDRYAHRILIAERDRLIVRNDPGGNAHALILATYEYSKLKLFFMSVLWRAAVSRQVFFRRVDLGTHEKAVREALLSGDAGDPDYFSVVVACFTDLPKHHIAMLDPFRERYDGVNYYRFFLGRYVAYIKVDSRKAPTVLREVQLTPGGPLIIIGREFQSSNEKTVMKRVLLEQDE